MTIAGSQVNLNGQWLERDQAQISVFDRGFIFGDGVYEVIPVYGHQPFLADRHVTRLGKSLAEVGITDPLGSAAWLELITTTAQRQDFPQQRIYLQVTRGSAPRLHRFPKEPQPTYLIFADPLEIPDVAIAQQGFTAVTHDDFRWLRGNIKSISLLAAVLASEFAAQAGAIETLFVRAGIVTEGATSNIIIAKDDALIAPLVDRRVLAGVTLSFIEECAHTAGCPIQYRDITMAQLQAADEVMISSSTRELAAITTLDGKAVGTGTAGPLFQRLWDIYRTRVNAA